METTMKRSGLVVPTAGYELDREEMAYIDGGDFFVGINLSASFCAALASYVPMSAKTGGIGLGVLGAIAMSIPQVNAIISPIIASVTGALASIPVIGWIAIGVIGASILAVLATGVIAGSQGKGFKFGIDVKTGWWGIPTGVNFVCAIR